MGAHSASNARSNFYRLIGQTAESHKPVLITGKRHNAVLVSEEDWVAIQETLHLLSIPSMRVSIRRGLKTPVSKCRKELRFGGSPGRCRYRDQDGLKRRAPAVLLAMAAGERDFDIGSGHHADIRFIVAEKSPRRLPTPLGIRGTFRDDCDTAVICPAP